MRPSVSFHTWRLLVTEADIFAGNRWRDQRSTNKKNRISPRTFLCGDGGAFVDMMFAWRVYAGQSWNLLPTGSKGLQIPLSENTATGRRLQRALRPPITSQSYQIMGAEIVFSLQQNVKKIMVISSHDAVVIWNRGWAKMARKSALL